MKTTISLLCLSLLLVFSCQKDELNETQSIDKLENTEATRDKGDNEEPLTEAEQFESMLQWISYITAEVLITDGGNAEEEFVDALNASMSNAIEIGDLLGFDKDDTEFYQAFRARYLYHLTVGDPGDPEGPGGSSPTLWPAAGGTGGDLWHLFLVAINDNNCLEYYLPNGYDRTMNIITTTGHPITTALTNDAYSHDGDMTPVETVLNNFNVGNKRNPILVRPDRLLSPVDCQYVMFPGIDFEAYLD